MKIYCALLIILFYFDTIYPDEAAYRKLMDESFARIPLDLNYSLLKTIGTKGFNDFSLQKGKMQLELTGFDEGIDQETYRLGTGDGFTIYIWGSINKQIEAVINHEGNLIIPLIGIVHLRNINLLDGKKMIIKKVMEIYKEEEISIALSKIRKFKVYILGEVNNPGPYIINGATRVSDLILLAGGAKINNSTDDNGFKELAINVKGQLRAIEIKNKNYIKQYADLALFYNYNIIDKNPYLNEGDRIFIPNLRHTISIFGAIKKPGQLNYMIGDSLITVLKAAGGVVDGADSTRILLTRFADNVDSLISYTLSFKDSSVFSFPVKKDDRILVCSLTDYRKHRQVKIEGEVKYPGIYPIRKDRTKLREIITQAGGLTQNAFLRGSKIKRREYTEFEDIELERLLKIFPKGLSPLEKSYLKTKVTEEEGIISIDFNKLLKNGNNFYNVILRDGDEITIRPKDISIKVIGAVLCPGFVSFQEGKGYEYYVDLAGGYNTKARKNRVKIIKGGTEIWLNPGKVKRLEAGDTIWIPERPYLNKFQFTKDVLLIFGQFATLLISTFTIQKLMN